MNYRFNTNNLPQLATWIGFDNMFDELDRLTADAVKKVSSWPPYNVRKISDDKFIIEVAAAGFGSADIEVTTAEDELHIKGEMKSDPSAMFVYKGIAERNFERTFKLADHVVVKNASMINGMLRVMLERMLPEEKKPRKVEVVEASSPDLKTFKAEALPE